MSRDRMLNVLILLFTVVTTIIPQSDGQFFDIGCIPIEETWAGLEAAIRDEANRIPLCSFTIDGDGCPDEDSLGIVVNTSDFLNVECEADSLGDNLDTQCVIDCPGRHFTIYGGGELVLRDITLVGATNSSIFVDEGGELQAIASIFRNNTADVWNGGAIRALEDSDVDILDCAFHNNDAFLGGAIYTAGVATITQSILYENNAAAAGGALFCAQESIVTVDQTHLYENRAGEGGAIYTTDLSTVNLPSSTVWKNRAMEGGGVYNGGNFNSFSTEFTDNVADYNGGAIQCDAGSTTVLLANHFVNNIAGGFGPAVHDEFNTRVQKQGNTACGNRIEVRDVRCDGIFVWISRRRVRCLDFDDTSCIAPTFAPTFSPTAEPTGSASPTDVPTQPPTSVPTQRPSPVPSPEPTMYPTPTPSSTPSLSALPSSIPTPGPSDLASSAPTKLPTGPPSVLPSAFPTMVASLVPTPLPSTFPSSDPTLSAMPSNGPTTHPSPAPSTSASPSSGPTNEPSPAPSTSLMPSDVPSSEPSSTPSISSMPSNGPTPRPSAAPSTSAVPSGGPTIYPSAVPTTSAAPTVMPSPVPTIYPSTEPTASPAPSGQPTPFKSAQPTQQPSVAPTAAIVDDTDDRLTNSTNVEVPISLPTSQPVTEDHATTKPTSTP